MQLNHDYQDFENPKGWIVCVLAPTGIAAYNVRGLTIHRFFKLPIFDKSKGESYWQLSDDNLKLIRQIVPMLKLIIIGKVLSI